MFILFSFFALAAFVRAGFESRPTVEVETLHVIEYIEVCRCPKTQTVLPVNPITTLICCDTCAPVTVTATTQPITSCTTQFTKTTAFCQTTGVYLLGDTLYPCNAPPCEIEYQAPCPTCYVCRYSECWVPNSNPRHVKVYEYFGNYNHEVDSWDENWTPTTWHETFVKTTYFPGPTVFIENDVQINITAAMDYTYTETSTVTSTAIATVTETASVPASSVGGSHPSPFPTDINFVLKSGSHAGRPVLILEGKLAFGSASDQVQTLRIEENEVFDLEGHIAYISTNDLSSRNKSFLNFVNVDSVPLDGRTRIFTLDNQGNLIVVVDNVTLIAIICESDSISFAYSAGTCEIVQIAPQGSVPTLSSSTPLSSATVPSSVPNLASIPAVSSRSPSSAPHSELPFWSSQPPSSSTPPSLSPAPSSALSNEPSNAPPSSITASEPMSSAPPPAPTFSLLMATVSNDNVDQGHGVSQTDTSTIDLTYYDQYNATLAGVNFTLECEELSDLCVFRLDPQGEPITSLTTDTNGAAAFHFNSIKAGFKCVRIYNKDHIQVKAIPIWVQQVVDCNAGAIGIVNVTNPLILLLGLDQPALQSSVFDLFSLCSINRSHLRNCPPPIFCSKSASLPLS